MGTTCSIGRGELTPDPVSGLSKKDIKDIKELWLSLIMHSTLKEVGTAFFIMLFEVHPHTKEYFPQFVHMSTEELKTSSELRAHSIAVFLGIRATLDCLDKTDTFITLVDKRAIFHYLRGVTFEDMENFKEVFLEFLSQRSSDYKHAADGIAAWEKMLTTHNNAYKFKLEELAVFNPSELEAKNLSGGEVTSE